MSRIDSGSRKLLLDDRTDEERLMRAHSKLTLAGVLTALLVTLSSVAQEPSTANGEWPSYGGNLSHDRYSPLDQITAENFSDLELAWTFNTDNLGPRPENQYQSLSLIHI